MPDWLNEAKTKPLLSYGAELIKSFVPKEELEEKEERLRKARDAAEKATEAARRLDEISTPVPMIDRDKKDRSPSYGDKSRENMDNLIQQNDEP
jgi:membrane protein required for colicin V production